MHFRGILLCSHAIPSRQASISQTSYFSPYLIIIFSEAAALSSHAPPHSEYQTHPPYHVFASCSEYIACHHVFRVRYGYYCLWNAFNREVGVPTSVYRRYLPMTYGVFHPISPEKPQKSVSSCLPVFLVLDIFGA